MPRQPIIISAILAVAIGIASGSVVAEEAAKPMRLTSPAFQQGQPIPPLYTCDGRNISPPLAWTDPPAGAKSFALISDDPDAPAGVWVHWVLYNVPASTRQLPAEVPKQPQLPDGSRQGLTDFRQPGYGGPCPPSGTHRYFFKLYALDVPLDLPPGRTAHEVEDAMQSHILAKAELMGTYQRKAR